jgi:3-methylfumaryl-CoA hydratase
VSRVDPVIERTEYLTPGPATALAALLDVPLPALDAGDGLPPLWHWLYLLDRPATADLGDDGHPLRGVLPVPPGPGRRRMWAGGSIRINSPLRTGSEASRRSHVLASVDKTGRSGPMTFVTVRHEISQGGRVCVQEDQDIVYRRAESANPPTAAHRVDAGPTPTAEPYGGQGDWHVETPTTLLFRFSALTYNGHRIHYDRDYARDVEGYPGLVVHGPLQALLMAERLRGELPTNRPGAAFVYRLLAPAFDHEGIVVSQAVAPVGAATADVHTRSGRHTATARFSPGRI